VAAIVTHAGMSTIAMALAAGVPMVCVPQGRDQPVNAARVHEVGAGLMVARDAAPEVLAAAVSRVLADVRFAATAQRIAAQAAAIGHGALAADLVEALVRVPALPSSG
jgi:UDP:flavonoid glycosyltransferase YjiC (YdhE family)